MYYSIVCPGTISGDGTWSERAFIGLMENDNPANNDGWVDKGYVITNASDKGLDFNVAANNYEIVIINGMPSIRVTLLTRTANIG